MRINTWISFTVVAALGAGLLFGRSLPPLAIAPKFTPLIGAGVWLVALAFWARSSAAGGRALRQLQQDLDDPRVDPRGWEPPVSGAHDVLQLAESVRELCGRAHERAERLEHERDALQRMVEDQRLTESNLRHSQLRIMTILETTNDPYVAVSNEGRITDLSSRAERMFQLRKEYLVGRKFGEFVRPEQETELELPWFEHLSQKAWVGDHEQAQVRLPDGHSIPVRLSLSTMEFSGSWTVNVFLHDLSRHRELEAQLLQAQKLESIGQLAAGVAHEINTPAQYVTDNTRFLEDAYEDVLSVRDQLVDLMRAVKEGRDAGPVLASLEEAIEEAGLESLREEVPDAIRRSLAGLGQIRSIVNAMKSFSHPDDERMEQTDLNAAIESTVVIARNEWKFVADVETELDPELPVVKCYPGRINQVLLNLLVNAAHAIQPRYQEEGEKKGRIVLRTRRQGSRVEIEVQDSGVGIPEENASRVFDPFFTTKGVGRGTGQGLSLARGIVAEQHGGSIEFDSEVGVGTTFVVRLPVNASEPALCGGVSA